MTHPFLTDPRNESAYQTLCDCPRGSTRAWAAKAGWTHSKMRTFIKNLVRLGLAQIEELPYGSLFVPVSTRVNSCEPVSTRAKPYLKAGKKLDKVPRYTEPKGGNTTVADARAPTPEEAQLIAAANTALRQTLPGFTGIELHKWTIAAAEKILAKVPLDRALKLVGDAARLFNPSATGGGFPHSLGHPFLTKYVFNESKRIEREEAKEQLPLTLISVEFNPEVISSAMAELRQRLQG